MKSILITLFSLIVAPFTYAGEGEKIAGWIQSGNSTELSNMFNTSIELVTPATSGVNTREQARMVLDNFFRNNAPIKATVTHETAGTSNSMIVISLVTKTGTFRISIVGAYKNGTFLINEFKIS
jgi:Domain of unknown function (DUF4783)